MADYWLAIAHAVRVKQRDGGVGATEGTMALRSFVSFGLTVICLMMVGTGLFMTLEPKSEGVMLTAPGKPGKISGGTSSATAFFEAKGRDLELTMLFTEDDDEDSVFRTRIRLSDGQSHSVVVGEPDDDGGAKKYTFVRVGHTIRMKVQEAESMNASFNIKE